MNTDTSHKGAGVTFFSSLHSGTALSEDQWKAMVNVAASLNTRNVVSSDCPLSEQQLTAYARGTAAIAELLFNVDNTTSYNDDYEPISCYDYSDVGSWVGSRETDVLVLDVFSCDSGWTTHVHPFRHSPPLSIVFRLIRHARLADDPDRARAAFERIFEIARVETNYDHASMVYPLDAYHLWEAILALSEEELGATEDKDYVLGHMADLAQLLQKWGATGK